MQVASIQAVIPYFVKDIHGDYHNANSISDIYKQDSYKKNYYDVVEFRRDHERDPRTYRITEQTLNKLV